MKKRTNEAGDREIREQSHEKKKREEEEERR